MEQVSQEQLQKQSACVDIVSLASCFIKSNIKSNLKLSAQSVSDKKLWTDCVWP